MKFINQNSLQHTQLRSQDGTELYSLADVVSDRLGAQQIFVSHEILAPERSSCSAHRHSDIEEIVYVLRGRLSVEIGAKVQTFDAGSFIYFDPKDQQLHRLMNISAAETEFIIFSAKRADDRTIYFGQDSWVPPTLGTPRLILRPIGLHDANSIFSYASNPNVSKYTLWEPHQNIKDSLNYIEDYILDYYAQGVPEPLGITLKEDPNQVVGTVGCFWISKQAKAMELAYAIAEEHWGKGLVAEASMAVMDYCFKEFSVKRIQARCKTENRASARVMEKLGMTYEGTLKAAVFHRQCHWDMHYFAKVAP
jgi:ribosomal-protein-alanine N-acetyltransferase